MSDADDNQFDISDNEEEEDMLYNEDCLSESEDKSTDDDIEIDELLDSKLLLMQNIKSNAEERLLKLVSENEIIEIYMLSVAMLTSGAVPFIDEHKFMTTYQMPLFNNPQITPELVSLILLLIMNIPVCIEKKGKMYNREWPHSIFELDSDYITCYYVNIKRIFRPLLYNKNKLLNKNILALIFKQFIEKINNYGVDDKEIEEINNVKMNLTNN